MIRPCGDKDFDAIQAIINDAAGAYRGIIPEDRWHEPYMSREALRREINDGIEFWGYEENTTLIGVMGIQSFEDVTLIRHAYVRTARRNQGIGGKLLFELRKKTGNPILMGTWADAVWAIRFYEKHGFRLVSTEEKNRLLREYWSIPERQIETSVVLADEKWLELGNQSESPA
jgi:N-acetylglutamate synthase-like GNAT family acetyltransferase